MTNSKELFDSLAERLRLNESQDELHSILYLLMQDRLGLTRSDILAGKTVDGQDFAGWDVIIERINRHEPIQYILENADFYGRPFHVNPSVLIPRPETELLIDEVLHNLPDSHSGQWKAVDIGTGSGVLAITLALELRDANIVATDISSAALATATGNAVQLNASVRFLRHDILTEPLPLSQLDFLISNPPYVAFSEQKEMKENVLEYEPHSALFVPDETPLIFYYAIARQARKVMASTGTVFVEINERFGRDVAAVFAQAGFAQVSIKRDLSNKDRFVMARF